MKLGLERFSFTVIGFTKQMKNPIELNDGSRPSLEDYLMKILPVHTNIATAYKFKDFRRLDQYILLRPKLADKDKNTKIKRKWQQTKTTNSLLIKKPKCKY
jgi:hypothetical protein